MRKAAFLLFALMGITLSSCWWDNEEETTSEEESSSYDWSSSSSGDISTNEPIDPDDVTTDAFDFTLLDFEIGEQLDEEASDEVYNLIDTVGNFSSLESQNYSYFSDSDDDFYQISYRAFNTSYDEEFAEGNGIALSLVSNLDQLFESQIDLSLTRALIDNHLLSQECVDDDYSYSFEEFEEESLQAKDYLPYLQEYDIYELEDGIAIYVLTEVEEEKTINIGGLNLSYNEKTTFLYYFEFAYYEYEIEPEPSDDSSEDSYNIEEDNLNNKIKKQADDSSSNESELEESEEPEPIIVECYQPVVMYETTKIEVDRDLQTGVALNDYSIYSINSSHLRFTYGEIDLEVDRSDFLSNFPTSYLNKNIEPSYSLGEIDEISDGIYGLVFGQNQSIAADSIKLFEGGDSLQLSFTLLLNFAEEDLLESEELSQRNDIYIRLETVLGINNLDLEELSIESDTLSGNLNPSGDNPCEGISFVEDGSNDFIKVDGLFNEDIELRFSFLISLEEEGFSNECLSSYLIKELPSNA